MNPQTSLTLLTIVGLIVGSIGGLISQLSKTSVEVDGTTRKRLTSAGKWALAISLLGFTGSFASELLKSSVQAQQRAQAEFDVKLKKERERQDDLWKTRSDEFARKIFDKTTSALNRSEQTLTETINGFEKEQEDILNTRLDIADSRQRVLSDNLLHETRLYGRLSGAGTPLTTMTIRLIITAVPSEVRQKLVKGLAAAKASTTEPWYVDQETYHATDRHTDQSLIQSVMDQKVIQPLIGWIGTDEFNPDLDWKMKDQAVKGQGILALSLDRHYSALACVGWVSEPDIFRPEKAPKNRPVTTSLLPSGVLIGDEIEFPRSKPSHSYTREKTNRPAIKVDVVKDSLVLTIELTRLSLNDSLIRYAKNGGTTAALPDNVEFFSWSPSGEAARLPFDPVEVNDGIPGLDKQPKTVPSQIPSWFRRMRLQIIPNGIDEISKTYDLTFSSAGDIVEGSRDDDLRGYVRLWHGHARL
jgi:hypothetical protein